MCSNRSVPRAILHLDMDAFFAAVEVLDNPTLRGKPVIVGGTPEGRGVVSTASYEARRYGVHSAMPAATAVRLCPRGVFLRPRLTRYHVVSRQVFRLLREYTPLVEPLSIDEAFLDVSGSHPLRRPPEPTAAEAIARELQDRVHDETGGLTCSLGVASNKFLAKLASDLEKPNGLVVVPATGVEEFLAPLEIDRLWGVGPKTAEHLRSLGLDRIGDLQRVSERDLLRLLGRELGDHLARLCRGLDDRPVVTDSDPKSIGHETTFGEFIPSSDRERLEGVLFALSDAVASRLRRAGLWGRTVTLKVRDERFVTRTRATQLDSPACTVEEIFAPVRSLLRERIQLANRKVRLLGVSVSGLVAEPHWQLEFFESRDRRRSENLAEAADAVREKFGDGAITRGRLLPERPDTNRKEE